MIGTNPRLSTRSASVYSKFRELGALAPLARAAYAILPGESHQGGADTSIASQAELREAYREPAPRAQQKVLDHIDRHARDFIALSPFCVMSSLGADGCKDTSHRGDPPGFVAVLDERTLLIPDRPGSNQVDSLRNVLAHPEVGLLFLVPGMNETLRVSGTTEIVTDAALLAPLSPRTR